MLFEKICDSFLKNRSDSEKKLEKIGFWNKTLFNYKIIKTKHILFWRKNLLEEFKKQYIFK